MAQLTKDAALAAAAKHFGEAFDHRFASDFHAALVGLLQDLGVVAPDVAAAAPQEAAAPAAPAAPQAAA
jgi:hypothetical protein